MRGRMGEGELYFLTHWRRKNINTSIFLHIDSRWLLKTCKRSISICSMIGKCVCLRVQLVCWCSAGGRVAYWLIRDHIWETGRRWTHTNCLPSEVDLSVCLKHILHTQPCDLFCPQASERFTCLQRVCWHSSKHTHWYTDKTSDSEKSAECQEGDGLF